MSSIADQDNYGKASGLEVVKLVETTSHTQITLNDSHADPSGNPHPGVLYTMAHSTMSYLSPFSDKKAESIEVTCNHVHKVKMGDTLQAQGSVMTQTSSTGVYQVAISNQTGEVVFWMKGTFKNI